MYRRFLARKKIVEILGAEVERGNSLLPGLKSASEEYSALLKAHRLRDFVVGRKNPGYLRVLGQAGLMLLLLPLHLYGMVLNYLPYAIPIWLASNIKDKHFLGSVRFGTGFLLLHLWWILIGIALLFIPLPILIKVVFFLTGPLTGVFAFYHYRSLIKLSGKLRWLTLKRKDHQSYQRIKALRKRILELLDEIVKQPSN